MGCRDRRGGGGLLFHPPLPPPSPQAYFLNPAIYSAHLKLHPLLVLSVSVGIAWGNGVNLHSS